MVAQAIIVKVHPAVQQADGTSEQEADKAADYAPGFKLNR